VFFNKIVMSNYEFPLPLFVSWFQFLVQLVCLTVLGWAGQTFYPTLSFIKPPSSDMFDSGILYKVLPLTLLYISMICFSNLTLRWSQVSFYQVARSLTIIFSIIFTYFMLGKTTTWPEIKPCLVVVVGFILGVMGEVDFVIWAVVFGICSSVFLAIYAIKVKTVIEVDFHNDQWIVTLYNTVEAIVLMVPIIFLSGEIGILLTLPIIHDARFWGMLFLSGIVGFLINIATFFQIKTTSPLTANLSGTVKACVQTILGVLIWKNEISIMNGFGIALVIGGSLWYSLVRYWISMAGKK